MEQRKWEGPHATHRPEDTTAARACSVLNLSAFHHPTVPRVAMRRRRHRRKRKKEDLGADEAQGEGKGAEHQRGQASAGASGMGLGSQRSQPRWGKGGRGRESLGTLFTLQGARAVRVKPEGAQHVGGRGTSGLGCSHASPWRAVSLLSLSFLYKTSRAAPTCRPCSGED